MLATLEDYLQQPSIEDIHDIERSYNIHFFKIIDLWVKLKNNILFKQACDDLRTCTYSEVYDRINKGYYDKRWIILIEYFTTCCTEHAINYVQIHKLWKILKNKSHLENALIDIDKYPFDYVYKKATEGYYSQRTLEDIEYVLNTWLNIIPCPKDELRVIEDLCYTAYETGILSLRLYGEELEKIIKIIHLSSFLTQEEREELRIWNYLNIISNKSNYIYFFEDIRLKYENI